jgi:hypothetical protein
VTTQSTKADDTLVRLLVRRGIPYGRAYPDPRHAATDGEERGLIFISYQASIERQFEFLVQNWMNGDDAPHVGGGRDAVLGRHGPQNDLPATAISIVDPAGAVHHLPQTTEFMRGRIFFCTVDQRNKRADTRGGSRLDLDTPPS